MRSITRAYERRVANSLEGHKLVCAKCDGCIRNASKAVWVTVGKFIRVKRAFHPHCVR